MQMTGPMPMLTVMTHYLRLFGQLATVRTHRLCWEYDVVNQQEPITLFDEKDTVELLIQIATLWKKKPHGAYTAYGSEGPRRSKKETTAPLRPDADDIFLLLPDPRWCYSESLPSTETYTRFNLPKAFHNSMLADRGQLANGRGIFSSFGHHQYHF